MWPTDVGALAGLLHETADHHGAFEAVAPPHDWWDWYAAYMDARQRGIGPDAASAAAGRYMAEVKHIVVPDPAPVARPQAPVRGGPAAKPRRRCHQQPTEVTMSSRVTTT